MRTHNKGFIVGIRDAMRIDGLAIMILCDLVGAESGTFNVGADETGVSVCGYKN